MAAVRATFMEHLAPLHPELAQASDAGEQAFMTGILSLLDRIFDVKMPELVARLNLSENASAALAAREGPLGQLLGVAEKLEELAVEDAGTLLAAAGIAREEAFSALRHAYAWKSSLG